MDPSNIFDPRLNRKQVSNPPVGNEESRGAVTRLHNFNMNKTHKGTAKLYIAGAKRDREWRFKIGVTEQVDVQRLLNRYPDLTEEYECSVWASAFLPRQQAYDYANKLYDKYPVDQDLAVLPIGGCQLRQIPVKTVLKIGKRIRELNKQTNSV